MQESNGIDLKTKQALICFLFPVIFLSLYAEADFPAIFKLLIYLVPGWLIYCLSFRRMQITNSGIIFTKYAKPFSKEYRISLSDIDHIYIYKASARRLFTLTIYLRSGKKMKIQVIGNQEGEVCKFFIDKQIRTDTNFPGLRDVILQYNRHPARNP